MGFKSIVITMGLLLILNGCERGVGEEPISVNDVNDSNLTGTWVLSKKYTDKKYLKYLKIQKVNDYYFTIKDNHELDYHSFNPNNNREISEANGKWSFVDKYLNLEVFHILTTYIDRKGIYHYMDMNGNSPKGDFVKITKENILGRFKRFRITKKNNKLLLWYYEGDPDARRYVMYEKNASSKGSWQ